jgi:hypothetical protein
MPTTPSPQTLRRMKALVKEAANDPSVGDRILKKAGVLTASGKLAQRFRSPKPR